MLLGYPAWVLAYKGKGKEIRRIKGNYYLYQVRCVWNKERKRPQKITESFLGRITETGLVKKDRSAMQSTTMSVSNICIKEYGVASFLLEDNKDVLQTLQTHFKDSFEALFCAAINRFVYQSPLKNMEHHYENSYLSELLPHVQMDDKSLSTLLLQLGSNRVAISAFMKQFMQPLMNDDDFLLMDATQVLSLSETLENAQTGYNSKGNHTPQVSLLYLFAAQAQLPAFYRMTPGNVKEVAAMSLTLQESEVQKAVVVADKGFFSDKNIKMLDDKKLQYIVPLRRSSSLIDYSPCEQAFRKGFTNYIRFNDRVVWYYDKQINDNQRVILYLDENLAQNEQNDYLLRIEKEQDNYSLENYQINAKKQGTIALLTNLKTDKTPEQVYTSYKSRADIEILFDTFRNTLHADRSYMRSNEMLEAWLFINHLALIFYYRLYKRLIQHDMLKKYSPKDILTHLKTIKKVKINDNWFSAEIPSKSKAILTKAEIPMA